MNKKHKRRYVKMELNFTVTPNELKERLMRLTGMDEPPAVFLWGQPGIGKTQVVYQVAEEAGLECKVMVLSLMDPVELKGFLFPNRKTKEAEYFPLSFPKEKFILFFDEFNTAPVAVQNAAMRIVLEKKIGDYALPKGTLVICAGNRMKDKVNVSKMSSAMVNRAIHYGVVPSFDDFKQYWYSKKLAPEVIGYLEMYPSDLCHEPSVDMPFPTPRTWEMVARYGKFDDVPTISGLLGDSTGLKFAKFVENCYGIDEVIKEVIKGEKIYPKEEETERSYMLISSLVDLTDENNLPTIVEYVVEAPDYFSPFGIALIKNLRLKGIQPQAFLSPKCKAVTTKLYKKFKFAFENA
jgi:hypothetical protein